MVPAVTFVQAGRYQGGSNPAVRLALPFKMLLWVFFFFSDILAGFTFNHRVLRLPANRFIEHDVSKFVFNWRLLLLNFYFFVQSEVPGQLGEVAGVIKKSLGGAMRRGDKIRGCVDSHATRSVDDEARRDREVLVVWKGMVSFAVSFKMDFS